MTDTVIDVRRLPPPERHATIFSAFQTLTPGQAIELHNDHDPRPLHGQFLAQWPNQFDWAYVEAGPELWRVRIQRKAAGKSCCGCCGG